MKKLMLVVALVLSFAVAAFAQMPVTGNVSGLSSGHSVYILIVTGNPCSIEYLTTGLNQYGDFAYYDIDNKCRLTVYPIDNASQYRFDPVGITVHPVGGVCGFGQTCPSRSGLQFYATPY